MIYIILFLLFAIPLAIIDFKYYILPDVLTFSMLWCGLLINSFYNAFCPISMAILGVIIGYLGLYLVYWVYYFFTHKEGIGFGDFKLLASLGAWFGVFSLPNILLIGSVSGLIFVIFKNIININKNIDNGQKIIKKDILNINSDQSSSPSSYPFPVLGPGKGLARGPVLGSGADLNTYPEIDYIAFGPFLLLGAGLYLLTYYVAGFKLNF